MNNEAGEKKEVKNNVPAMRQKLIEMQTKLNWVERLDLVNGPAPLAPELAYKEELHSKERASRAKQAGGKLEEDVVHNDFKREMLFYRQAQLCWKGCRGYFDEEDENQQVSPHS